MNAAEIIHQTTSNNLIKQEDAERTKRYILEQHAASTRKAYRSDIVRFQAWCQTRELCDRPADPQVVAMFLAHEAELGATYSTIKRRAAAIRYYHTTAAYDTPTNSELVRATLSGIRKTVGIAPNKKAPAVVEKIYQLIAHCPPTLTGLRDKALLLLGFSGAFRRSELAGLQVKDIEEVAEGLKITLSKSKTDQEGAGQTVAIYKGSRLQAVETLKAWMAQANISSGPLFRRVRKNGKVGDQALSAMAIVDIIKSYAFKAGLDPKEFAGHSLRAGFLTTAAESGASIFKMMEVSRHKSVDTLKGYVRNAELFKNHAGAKFL